MFRRVVVFLSLLVVTLSASAQIESSLSAYSPYTMYGLGDIFSTGNISSRSMGGMGVAQREGTEFNYLNPAALSAMPQRTAIFNFETVASNYYQQYGDASNAYNSVDLQSLGFAVPIAKYLGLGVSLTPLSGVGYNTMVINNNQNIIEDIGRAVYSYYGDGGVSELSLSLGWRPLPGLSIGASMHYDFGSISRVWTSELLSLVTPDSYRTLTTTEDVNVNTLRYTLGAQYQIRVGSESYVNLGFTYTGANATELERERLSTTTSTKLIDTVSFDNSPMAITMPEKLAFGLYFSSPKLGVGLDYHYQDWTGAFEVPENITLTSMQDFRFGVQYTPDRNSIRSLLDRVTYKVGARYATSYLYNGTSSVDQWSVSAGLEIPLQTRNLTAMNIGVEYAQREAIGAMLKEQQFRIFVGFSLFGGDDMWFVKRKFD